MITSKTKARPREKIDPARWRQLKEILADALEQPSRAARTAFVESRCANDATLLAEAESLVREAQALLEDPTDPLEDCAEQATVALWQDEPSRNGWRIGAYIVTRELGRGGMGTVYLAARADGQFEKEVAIKVLKRGTDTEEVLQRFAAERHILARLDHPNIARLLDAGTTDDGLPYFVMEYVAGAPVTRYAREHQLPIRERLAIFLKICAAVQVAHQNHVIHRDLKPSNILVNAEGEPKLLDFGIAKLLTPGVNSAELTTAGRQCLTPICASPEQTDGRKISEASDVYALGALLYEMLSGQRPYKFSSTHPSREEVARVVREQEPIMPSRCGSDPEEGRLLRGDLDAIVTKAMCKEPEMRYAGVSVFADDIRRHLAREPVLAPGGSPSRRARAFLSRSRALRAVAAGVAILLVLAGILFVLRGRSNEKKSDAAAWPAPNGSSTDLQKSIAVLPFDSFGDSNEPAYLADGVQDNILTDLGRIGDLKVISRSGVSGFRGKLRDVKEIGRKLGVKNVLEGSVQISGDRVRINAQLIDTSSDTQVWAEHYDRKIEDIFALQSELAQTIATQLNATLSNREKAAIWKRPTEDMQAYDFYLRARSALNSGERTTNPSEHWANAIELLNAAISRDPKFALAYCLLNEAYVYTYRFGDDHTPERLAAAKEAAEAALKLEPALEEAHLALARYYYNGLFDYSRTQEEISKLAASSSAHEVEYYTLAGLVERRLGQWEAAVRDGRRAVELDPQAPQLAFNFVQTLTGLKRYDESLRVVDAAILRQPAKQGARLWLLKSELELARGNLEAASAALDAMPAKEDMDYKQARVWLCFLRRDFTVAKQLVGDGGPDLRRTPSYWSLAGSIARASGDKEVARAAFEESRRLALIGLQKRQDEPEILGELGLANAALGATEEALAHARRAVEVRPTSVDALAGPVQETMLAQILAWTGDRDGALKLLRELVKVPFGPSYGDLKFNPVWDDLRGDQRFRQLLADAALIVSSKDKAEPARP